MEELMTTCMKLSDNEIIMEDMRGVIFFSKYQ